MDVADFLSPADVLLDVRAVDKKTLLADLARHAAASVELEPAIISGELLKREELGSTGLGDGVAIPHTRLQQLKKPFAVLARLKRPMEFDAIDGQPVDLVVLLLLPATGPGDQLNALAGVARKLRDKDIRRLLRAAADTPTLHGVMAAPSQAK